MPVPPKPKVTLRLATAEEARKMMFEQWIDECSQIQEAFIEGLLATLADSREGNSTWQGE
jgi:hypothetical protein